MKPIDLQEKLGLIQTHWDPKIIAELNGQHVKLAKIKGEFVWHSHADEDELFMVIKGQLRIEYRDGVTVLEPGQITVVPKGVEHRPVAEEEVHILLFEPASTLNTGDTRSERTKRDLERI